MNRVGAVIVDYHAGELLDHCVESIRAEGVLDIVVVENGAPGSVPDLEGVRILQPGVNLGYGRGVNRGVAALPASTYLLVANPDVVVHEGAVAALVSHLEANPDVAIVGPTILRSDGTTYPSHRVFPNVLLAGLHAVLEPWWPDNPATARYRAPRRDGSADWVSGACFLVRRDAFEQVGGFDERYFMFAEDMALCFELGERGWRVGIEPDAVVTHVEGVSRARMPTAMLIAHHRSALRFEAQSARGWRRALVPVAALVLGLRLAAVLVSGRARPRPS